MGRPIPTVEPDANLWDRLAAEYPSRYFKCRECGGEKSYLEQRFEEVRAGRTFLGVRRADLEPLVSDLPPGKTFIVSRDGSITPSARDRLGPLMPSGDQR
jgi:hypothetical protein